MTVTDSAPPPETNTVDVTVDGARRPTLTFSVIGGKLSPGFSGAFLVKVSFLLLNVHPDGVHQVLSTSPGRRTATP